MHDDGALKSAKPITAHITVNIILYIIMPIQRRGEKRENEKNISETKKTHDDNTDAVCAVDNTYYI